MKYFKEYIFIVFAATMLLFQSCDDIVPPINPEDNKIDRLKWTYDFSTIMAYSLDNQIPAIDEEGNIYLAADVQYGGQIVKLSESGQELWLKKENDFPLSRLMYFDGKVFYITNNKLICRQASDGEKLWEADASGGYKTLALSNNKIYTIKFVDGGIFGSNHTLLAYDYSGNQVWETKVQYSPVDTMCYANAISVNGNNIYLGVFAEVDNSDFAIINYVDGGNSVSKGWTWLAPEDYSVGGGSPRIADFAIDDNSNLIFGMEKSSVQYIFSLSPSGIENWHSETSLPQIISSVSVDGSGNCFASYDKCEKIDNNGIVWSSEIKTDWDYLGLTSKGPAISDNGDLYFQNPSKLLTAVDYDGNFLWEQFYNCDYCNDVFHNVTINRNGDIILISKAAVYCFKGNGKGLANAGWPKPFGNYGNTASK